MLSRLKMKRRDRKMLKLNKNIIVTFALAATFSFLLFENHKFRSALNGCIEEVTSKCSQIWEYASELERENARLNELVKEIKNEMPSTCFTPVEGIQ